MKKLRTIARLATSLSLVSMLACGGDDSADREDDASDGGSKQGDAGGGRNDAGKTDAGTASSGTAGRKVPAACSTPKPTACPGKVLEGDVSVRTADDLAQLEGVTEITGALSINQALDLSALSCLQKVGDTLELDLFGASSDENVSLAPLRSLTFVGGDLDISSTSTVLDNDCAFEALESIGSEYLTGGAFEVDGPLAGTLSLTALEAVTHVRITGSSLTQLALPSNVTLKMGQLFLQGNTRLAHVAGFEKVKLQQSGIQVSGALSVRIVGNSVLPTCRAESLRDAFVAAGFAMSTMELSDNESGCAD